MHSIHREYRVNKNAWPNLQKVNLHHNKRKKYYENIGLLKHGFRVMTFWIKKMLQLSTWIFKAGHCRSEQWLPYPLENSKSHVYHLKSILYLLLQVLDVADFCSMKSRLQRPPWDKNLRDLKQRNKQAILLVHLILSIVLETQCLRIFEQQQENVIEHHYAWTINEF